VTGGERVAAVKAGMRQFGILQTGQETFTTDFFMTDPQGFAASFHIGEQRDIDSFVRFANPKIQWIASENTVFIQDALADRYAALARKMQQVL